MPSYVIGPAFAQESSLLSIFEVVVHTLYDWAVWVELARVAHILTGNLHGNFAENRLKR